MKAMMLNSQKIAEQIQDGQSKANEVLRLIALKYEELNDQKTAQETFKEEVLANLNKIFKK